MAYAKTVTRTLSAIYPMTQYMKECDLYRVDTDTATDEKLGKVHYFAKSAFENRRWVREYYLEKYDTTAAQGGFAGWELNMDALCIDNVLSLSSFFSVVTTAEPIAQDFTSKRFEKEYVTFAISNTNKELAETRSKWKIFTKEKDRTSTLSPC